MRQFQDGEEWSICPIFPRPIHSRIFLRCGFCDEQFEGLERLAQLGSILLAVVAKPSFPKREGAYAVIWHGGLPTDADVYATYSVFVPELVEKFMEKLEEKHSDGSS